MKKISILVLVATIIGMLAGIPLFGGTTATAAPLDYDIQGGHFFTQTNGLPEGTSVAGFSVTNNNAVPFWDQFQSLGGVARVGYPMSRRFTWDGFVTQVFQKAVFQWRPEVGKVYFINVFDQMSVAGKDTWLANFKSTPPPLDGATFDAGKSWPEIVASRQALLDANPAIKAVYFSAQDPMSLYGLPTSRVTDNGNHFAVRLQRAVIQQWKVDVPWAKAGQATIANGGDVAVQAGMFASDIVSPEYPPGVPTPTPVATATPTATPRPAVTFSQTGQVRYQQNAGTQWVEGRIYSLDGSPRNGVKVKVTASWGYSIVSRPSGSEMRSDPNGVWAVLIRSAGEGFLDGQWTAEVIEDNGQAVTSDKVVFFTDADASSPDKRQVAFVDFKRNY